jgi:glycosyltransferase involved in cell wall biosynthesis
MNPSTGGPCQGIRYSIAEMDKLGVYNEVVCLDNADAAFLSKDNFRIHAIGQAKGPWSYNPELVPWLVNHLGRFDVLIVHGLWSFHGYAVRKALRQYKKNNKQAAVPKIYIMPHGMLDPWFQKAKGRKLKAVRNWFYWKLVEAKLVNNADGLLFTCEQELRLARQTFYPYRPKKELNVGYGISAPPEYSAVMDIAFKNICTELKEGNPYILFLSRIHEKKGVDLLIKAYATLLESSHQNKDLKLVIAGPGFDSYYGKKIRQLVLNNTLLKDQVFFPGMLTGNAKWGAIYGCEAFILPSHQENFGIAVVEALACGKPVLISNQINIFREIESNGGGIVVDDSVSGITELLQQWSKLTVSERKAMGKKAYATYHKYFNIGATAMLFFEAIN